MNTFNSGNFNQWNTTGDSAADSSVKAFMSRVFGWMFGALVITALTSYLFAVAPELSQLLYKYYNGKIVGFQPLATILMFAPFILVLVISFGYNKLSFPALAGIFILFSILFGASFSTLFLRYSMSAIGISFGITAGMFGIMAVMGFTTKADLTKFGAILTMGLVGLIIASLVNFFIHSETMYYLISFAGVAVFTGLTAYDVQKLKNIGAGITYGDESAAKLSILGALSLYLDFINLFIFVLRLVGGGNRR